MLVGQEGQCQKFPVNLGCQVTVRLDDVQVGSQHVHSGFRVLVLCCVQRSHAVSDRDMESTPWQVPDTEASSLTRECQVQQFLVVVWSFCGTGYGTKVLYAVSIYSVTEKHQGTPFPQQFSFQLHHWKEQLCFLFSVSASNKHNAYFELYSVLSLHRA